MNPDPFNKTVDISPYIKGVLKKGQRSLSCGSENSDTDEYVSVLAKKRTVAVKYTVFWLHMYLIYKYMTFLYPNLSTLLGAKNVFVISNMLIGTTVMCKAQKLYSMDIAPRYSDQCRLMELIDAS